MQSYEKWENGYTADTMSGRIGLKMKQAVYVAVITTGNHMLDLATLGLNNVEIERLDGVDLSKYSVAPYHLLRMSKPCSQVKDVCSAISCLGHRTQETLSLQENLGNVPLLESIFDGREFAVCRHYAPSFSNACNMWAKENKATNILRCEAYGTHELGHAWPVISIKEGGIEYNYLYDILNDPLTPDLVPTNSAARERSDIPCPSI